MTAALAIALLARQTAASVPPSLPLGTSPEFAKVVMAVETQLVEGDVAGAREAARALPVRAPRLAWGHDADLPPALRNARAAGLEVALAHWSRTARDFAPKPADGGAADVTIDFAPVLPDGPDGVPLPVRVDSAVPFRASVALSRGKPAVPLRPEEMNMEVAHAIGRYLGVPVSPLPGSSMYVDGRPGLLTFWPRPEEAALAARNLDFADRVRAAVAAGKPLGIAPPAVRLVKERLDLGTIEQGKPLLGSIGAENVGAGTLLYSVLRDCDCFDPIRDGEVPAQARKSVDFRIKTLPYAGRVQKLLLFRSNDPERPTIEVPVTFFSRPPYRLIHPGGDRVTVPAEGGAYDLFFFTPSDSKIHFLKANWSGADAKVSQEPWSGVLADPEMGEGPLPRTGWRFHVRVPASLPPGRPAGTLTLATDSPLFSTVTSTLNFQKGIVADEANLGDFAPGDEGTLIVDRPGAPFKIKRVDAGPLMTATVSDRRGGWEYMVRLAYKGGAPKGDFVSKVIIHTDDPKQREVVTLAKGYVK